ncbi:MAG: hypothetical protein ACU0AT_11605 [Tranquillimonas sp.]
MNLWLRLVSICLSFAILGGIVMHDLAGARLSFDMAAAQAAPVADATGVVAEGSPCPLCVQDEGQAPLCKLDCTAAVGSGVQAAVLGDAPQRVTRLALPGGTGLTGRGAGLDPSPPRSTSLS